MVLGRVAAPHGVKGWIKVQIFGQTSETLLRQSRWRLGGGERWREFAVSEARAHGNTVLALLEGLETREAAAGVKGLEVSVPRDRLPAAADGEYYWTDLQGMEVVNREGMRLGHVDSLFSNGPQSVLVVWSGGTEGEILIPFVAAYVDGVDASARRIRVDWHLDWV